MIKAIVYSCALQVVVSIIVTDPPPTSTDYNYWYDIVDPSTGDTKSQHEYREGDVVTGSYSVIDPDGTKRTVEYTADAKHGFQAVVRNEPARHNSLNKRHYITHFPSLSPIPNPVYTPVPKVYAYPVPYARIEAPTFSANQFVESRPRNLFTPGNDTSSDKLTFNKGEFFIPNYLKK